MKYMEMALEEAKKAYKNGDVPVGAVIVKDNKIISKAYNKKEKNNVSVYHAEILAIIKACKKLKTWRLDGCSLYVTLEPCLMCSGAIIHSRISKVYFATKNEKFGYVSSIDSLLNKKNNHKVEIEEGLCKKQAQRILIDFFKNKRK
ncbi:MAG: nucleoside deaminase [Firmicutes bacterium]|nr:nucleoside deaminase [Bacillota bacterium]